MNNVEELLQETCKKDFNISNKVEYRINYTLNNLDKYNHFPYYFKKLATAILSLLFIIVGGVSAYATFGGKIEDMNPFEWIGIKISNQIFNEYKENVENQLYSNGDTSLTLSSTLYNVDLVVLEFDLKLSEEDKNYLKISKNVIPEDYLSNDSYKADIDITIDGKQYSNEEKKEFLFKQYENQVIDNIWLSINNEEAFDKNGNSYIEGTYNNNYILINDVKYSFRDNTKQIVKKINDYEYKIFQTYFLPPEDFKDDNIKLTISNLEVIANKTQLGDTQKRIHILDSFSIKLQKSNSDKNVSNINIIQNINNNLSQNVEYIEMTPMQTIIKISTQIENVSSRSFANPNDSNYIGPLYYETYDKDNNLLSSYTMETKRTLTYSDGSIEELPVNDIKSYNDFKNAKLNLTQYLVCEKVSNNIIIRTFNYNHSVINELNLNL